MKDEEFGRTLLAAIEQKGFENNKQDYVAMKQLAGVVSRALGIQEQQNYVPAPIPQLPVRPEFPHLRLKLDSAGNEIARRRVNSMGELAELSRNEPGFNYVSPVEE